MRSDQRRALGDLGHGGGDDGGGRGNEAVGTAVRAGTAGSAGTGTGGGAGGGGGGTSGRGLGFGSSSAHPIPPTITGLADSRQQHRLVLKSAYSSYSWDGEPPLTCVEQNFVGTLDYVMYSSEKLVSHWRMQRRRIEGNNDLVYPHICTFFVLTKFSFNSLASGAVWCCSMTTLGACHRAVASGVRRTHQRRPKCFRG